jgi:hypothetical protein
MNQLATAVRGDPVDNVGGVAVSAPVVPVFVDATGRRRKVVTGFGWLVALACVAYLAVIGVSMTGTSVGPLPDLPSVASRVVVFGSEADALPQGALEVPLPVLAPPAAPQAAAAPNFSNSAKVAARTGTAPKIAPKPAPKTAPKIAPKPAPKAAPKTAPKTAPKKKAPTVDRTTSSARIGGASR